MLEYPRSKWADLGRFVLSPGTIVNTETILGADGTEEELGGQDRTINIDGSVWCAWIESEGRFIPMSELEAAAARDSES
ncbi:hypothetical protein [Nocardioides speluncae]|nr:hypothetical protein [Nocardioides speluncae]